MLKKIFSQKNFTEKMMGRLTEEQKKHFVTIEWLVNFEKNMGKGRTYLLAIAFVKRALEYQDRWIEIFDHNQNIQAKKMLLSIIYDILNEDKELLEKTEFKQYSFRIRNRKLALSDKIC